MLIILIAFKFIWHLFYWDVNNNDNNMYKHRKQSELLIMKQWIVSVFQYSCHNCHLQLKHHAKCIICCLECYSYVLVDEMAYQLSGLFTAYLKFSKVNSFILAVFINTINWVDVSLILTATLKEPHVCCLKLTSIICTYISKSCMELFLKAFSWWALHLLNLLANQFESSHKTLMC